MNHVLEAAGVTEDLIEAAVAAMFADLEEQTAESSMSGKERFQSWHPELQTAYLFAYTAGTRAGKTGKELSKYAAIAVVYALKRSDVPSLRAYADELIGRLGRLAYEQINAEFRQFGEHPSFRPLACSECDAAEYRDDQAPRQEWGAPNARWRCAACGKPLAMSDVLPEDGEQVAIRGHVLGLIRVERDTQQHA